MGELNGGYACARYDFDNPEVAHATLLAYVNGGNEKGIYMSYLLGIYMSYLAGIYMSYLAGIYMST